MVSDTNLYSCGHTQLYRREADGVWVGQAVEAQAREAQHSNHTLRHGDEKWSIQLHSQEQKFECTGL